MDLDPGCEWVTPTRGRLLCPPAAPEELGVTTLEPLRPKVMPPEGVP